MYVNNPQHRSFANLLQRKGGGIQALFRQLSYVPSPVDLISRAQVPDA